MRAFVYRDGIIGFHPDLPKKPVVLPIASGPARILFRSVEAVARHDYDGRFLLVPGVQEAEDENEAVDAVLEFKKQVELRISADRKERKIPPRQYSATFHLVTDWEETA